MPAKKITLLVAALTISVYFVFQNWLAQPQGLIINFFNVGQGDAILIQTPQKEEILIDGGPSEIILNKLGQTMNFFDREIDAIILTHPHTDHLVGLVEVLKKYKVKKIYSTGVLHTTKDYLEWLELIKEEKIDFQAVKAGDTLKFQQLNLEVLYPPTDLSGQTVESLNNSSIVLKFNYEGISTLLTGDIEREGEQQLEKSGINLKADILKVSHHGSAGSTYKSFIEKVKPKIAVISVGKKNSYGHPSPRVVKRLETVKAQIWRTDQKGDLKIEINNGNLRILK